MRTAHRLFSRAPSALLAALFLALTAAQAFAVDPFINDKAEGWFWYEREPVPPEPEKEQLPPPVVVVPRAQPEKPRVQPLSVEWFQNEYLKVMSAAIDKPTEDNVRRYRYATRVMLDKASNFAHVFERESLLDTFLDESVRMPFTSYARSSTERLTEAQRREATDAIAKKAGLWIFMDDSCPFCQIQYPVVARVVKARGFTATYITPDGKRPAWMDPAADVRKDTGQSEHLSLSVLPAIALVIPPDRINVITQGMLAADQLEERILFAADYEGLLTGTQVAGAFPERKGLLTPDDINALGAGIEGDLGDDFMRDVRARLKTRY